MAIPKQVEQAAQEIKELEARLRLEEDEQAEEAKQTEETAKPEVNEDVDKSKEVVEPEVNEEPWQQRYNTLLGKYNAEVPRLHQQIKELTSQVEYLSQQLAAKSSTSEESQRLITPEDEEQYGDLIDVQRRVAKEVMKQYEAKLKEYEEKISSLEQQLNQQNTQVTGLTFEQQLYRLVPDFAAINQDPKWIAWLNEVDPLLRAPRRVVAQAAWDRGDAEGVAYYVGLFKQSQEQNTHQTDRKTELERQIAPSRASGNTALQQQGKTYSIDQWNALYDRVAALVAKGKFEDARQLEAELSAAMSQGRVT